MQWYTIIIVSSFMVLMLSSCVLTDEVTTNPVTANPVSSTPMTTAKGTSDDPDVNPFNVREEGCPIVSERNNLNVNKLRGNWTLPFASLNWLADIGMSLYNSSVKMSQITSICPKIVIGTDANLKNRNAQWSLHFICPKLKGEFEIWCWHQTGKTKSKFICWNNKESRDLYLMIAATNHEDWIVVIRCSPKEEANPSEGMSWAIFSKVFPMDPNVSVVLFGLLEGYGFDVNEFKTQLLYDDCPS